MNVGFEELSTKDVADMIKVDQHTVADWCRKGRIKSTNVSGGDQLGRYLIPEDEADYLRKLFKKWGKTKAMRHYNVKRLEVNKVVTPVVDDDWEEPDENLPWTLNEKEAKELGYGVKTYEDGTFTIYSDPSMVTALDVEEPVTDNLEPQKVDAEKTAATISYIQDIKERLKYLETEKSKLLEKLEDLEAEKAQLINERSELKAEIEELL